MGGCITLPLPLLPLIMNARLLLLFLFSRLETSGELRPCRALLRRRRPHRAQVGRTNAKERSQRLPEREVGRSLLVREAARAQDQRPRRIIHCSAAHLARERRLAHPRVPFDEDGAEGRASPAP